MPAASRMQETVKVNLKLGGQGVIFGAGFWKRIIHLRKFVEILRVFWAFVKREC
jgi:hypothetical protein